MSSIHRNGGGGNGRIHAVVKGGEVVDRPGLRAWARAEAAERRAGGEQAGDQSRPGETTAWGAP